MEKKLKQGIKEPTGVQEVISTRKSNERVTNNPFRHWVALAIIILLGLLAYSNSFDCGFHFDDKPSILNNDHIKVFSFNDHFYNWSNKRVMGYLSLALNYHYNEFDVSGYHYFNLLIHLTNALLVFWLCFLLLSEQLISNETLKRNRYWIAFLTALLFVSHPMATQSVTYIVQRFASLVTLFYLLTVICYLRGRMMDAKDFKRYFFFLLSFLSFFLAIHTKENAFTLPFVILMMEVLFFQQKKWNLSFTNYRLYLFVSVAAILGFGIVSYFSMSVLKPIPPSYGNAYTLTPMNYLFTQFNVIPQYIRMLVLPYGQHLDHDFPIFNGLFDGLTWLNLGILVTLLVLSLFMIKRNVILSFGLLWFFITLAIESSIVPISDVFFEHRTYLPSVGFLLLLTSGIFLLLNRKGKIYPILTLIAMSLIFSYLTYERNKVWKSDLTLTLDNLQKAPNKSRTNLNYGMALYGEGKKDESLQYINKAVELNPEYYDAVNNRGNVLSSMGKIKEALPDYLKCTKMQPDNVNGLCNLGITYAILNKTDEAIQAFNRVLTLSPQNAQGHFNRGLLYYNTGKWEEAEKDLTETLRLNPGNEEASKYLNQIRNRK